MTVSSINLTDLREQSTFGGTQAFAVPWTTVLALVTAAQAAQAVDDIMFAPNVGTDDAIESACFALHAALLPFGETQNDKDSETNAPHSSVAQGDQP